MGELRDIVADAHPRIVRRKAGEAITAGNLLYLSADDTVKLTTGPTVAFEGVAVDSVALNEYLGVALPPTRVYVNTTETVAAGNYVMPDALGVAQKWAKSDVDAVICGLS